MSVFGLPLHALNLFQARLSRHELKDAVHAQHSSSFGLDGRGLEALPDHDSSILQDQRVLHVKEAGRPAYLLEVSSTEGLVDNGVENLTRDG